MRPAYIKELGLTPDEADVVERYREWVQARRMAGRLAPIYAEVERQYPELSPEERDEMVTAIYRKQMSDFRLKGRHSDEAE